MFRHCLETGGGSTEGLQGHVYPCHAKSTSWHLADNVSANIRNMHVTYVHLPITRCSHQLGNGKNSACFIHHALLSQSMLLPICVCTCLRKLLKFLAIGWLSLHLGHHNPFAPLGN